MNKRLVFLLLGLMMTHTVSAGMNSHTYYRTFWNPLLDDVRLAWCLDGGKTCGKATANRYCQMMGYERSVNSLVANDIGESRYLATGRVCKGWECDGFKKIKCVKSLQHSAQKEYYYRKQTFYFPRFEHERLAWCYSNGRSCGEKVAYSFCRRMGYMRTVGYKKQLHVFATEELGSNKLCYGENCTGFSSISCYR